MSSWKVIQVVNDLRAKKVYNVKKVFRCHRRQFGGAFILLANNSIVKKCLINIKRTISN
jgi:hypothetical protein